MRTQMELVIKNLETVIKQAGYACKNIVRLNIYTTSTDEVWQHFETFKTWMQEQDMKPAVTMLQVVGPEKFELEATAVK